MSAIMKRLDAHFAACAAAAAGAAMFGGVEKADAAVVHSGIVNINIPTTTQGVYLNVVTGVSATAPAGAPGWDVNPWGSSNTAFGLFSPTAPSGGAYVNLGANTFNLPNGTTISGANTFGSLGSTTNIAQWNLNGDNNFVGFRFQNEANGNQIHYGWMRIAFSTSVGAQPRTIVEYAYENVAGAAITIPAPGALALLGLAGLVGGRRRRS